MMKTYGWRELRPNVFDSDGANPDWPQFVEAMREFRRYDTMSGYWFYDPSAGEQDEGDGRVRDEFNDERRFPEDVGPARDDIDFTGLGRTRLPAERE